MKTAIIEWIITIAGCFVFATAVVGCWLYCLM
jgi:hypothetical protein